MNSIYHSKKRKRTMNLAGIATHHICSPYISVLFLFNISKCGRVKTALVLGAPGDVVNLTSDAWP